MSSVGDTSATFCATLVDEWIRLGVSHAVVAPGSRSTPLAVRLAERPEIKVHLFHDERSASFAALGIGEATGLPAVLLCTSGTAATHFHGAVVEAHLSNVPMIVCTADRPPELRDVGAPQTIDQTHLFGSAVRWYHDPGVPSDDASHTWRSLAARSFAASVGQRPGPVHVNLPFREPLLGEVRNVPPTRGNEWSTTDIAASASSDLVSRFVSQVNGRRGVIFAGRGSTPEVLEFAQKIGWPVCADARSGLRRCETNVVVAFDPILRHTGFADSHIPDVVLRVGEPPASKVTAQWLSRHGVEIVQVQSTSSVVDPDHSVIATYVASVAELFRSAADMVSAIDHRWAGEWNAAETLAQSAISEWTAHNWAEPTVARIVTDTLPNGGHLVVSSSMPIRDVEWFGTVTPTAIVHSNRGTNGIDGVISTAVGVAAATGQPTVVLVGDVACLHDSNGVLGLMGRDVDLKIVVTNNDGGSIFSFLPQASLVSTETFELLYGTPHGVRFDLLAAAHGIPFVSVSCADDLRASLSMPGTRMIEAPFVRHSNVEMHDRLNAAVIDAVSRV